MSKGRLFILSAPAGTGKTTLVDRLCAAYPNVRRSISYTTRPPRPGEKEGDHYHFISQGEFTKRREAGEFIECANVFGNWYGTRRESLEEMQRQGLRVILVIDTQGAMYLKGKIDAAFIFVKPPSLAALAERLKKRNTDTPEAMQKRLSCAEKEIAEAPFYDHQIVNDDFEKAYEELRAIIMQ